MNNETQKMSTPTMLTEYTQQLEKEQAELHSIADRIEQRLHKIKDTNYPEVAPDPNPEMPTSRGNGGDLEFQLFDSLESLRRVRNKLQESLDKLETII